MYNLHNYFAWQDSSGSCRTGRIRKLSGKSAGNVFFIIGGSVCALAVLSVSGIPAAALHRGAVCGADCAGHADYMVCGPVSPAE